MRPLELGRFVSRALQASRLCRAEPAAVLALQHRRLEALVRHAVRHSPFYRRRYAGISQDRCQLADLPPVGKAELMAHFEDVFTERHFQSRDLQEFMADPNNVGTYYKSRYALSHTSGSQGQPVIVVQDRHCLEVFFLLQMTRGNATGRPGLCEAVRRLVRPARLAVVVLNRGFYASSSAFSYLPDTVRAFVTACPLSMLDPLLVEKLNAFRPTVLAGYANVLARLAAEAEGGRLRLAGSLRQVVNHSETLTAAARDRLRSAFAVPVLNNYATAECSFLSNGCPTDPGSHINADWCIVEVVDEHNRPVPPGVVGHKVLVTNLANRVQPFIRYEVTDPVALAVEPCRCGSRLPRLAAVNGRRYEDFWVHDGGRYRALSPFLFKKAFLDCYEVREWQAVQGGRNAFTVRVEVLPGETFNAPRAANSIRRHLELYGFQDGVTFTLEVVPELASDPRTGKFRQAVSLVGPSAEARPA
jgi:phenylacetate-coenzyme A ligase PaaK-like adenylate-forming protein